MVSKRSLVTRNGVLSLVSRPLKPSVSSVCPFCSLIPSSRVTNSRSARSRRWKSTSATAIETRSSAKTNPRLELENFLLELQKRMPAPFDPSRLQLALQGLRQEPGREAIRIAILGLHHGPESEGRDTARKVLKSLLADPLMDEQDWERKLDEHDASQPLIVRVGGNGESGPRLEVSKGSKPRELHISSAVWNGLDLEILLMNVNAPIGGGGSPSVHELEQIALIPTVEICSTGNQVASLTTPVHQTLIVADGFMGAVNISSLPTAQTGDLVLAAVDLKGFSHENQGAHFVVMDTSLASQGIELFRKGPQHAMEYEDRWSTSKMAVLGAWLKAAIKTSDDETKPVVRKLVASVLHNILSTIDSEAGSKNASRDRISKTASPQVQVLNKSLNLWAQQAHAELQGQLDLAFTESRWRKLGWWKLFWRVDDVAMLANELLSQRFLPTAEQELVYLAGQIAQLQSKVGRYAQPRSLREESSDRAEKLNETPLLSTIPKPALPKWPGHIAFTRRYLQNETVPALQSLAQNLVIQSLTTSSLTSILAGLLYVSSFSSSVFEAGAVAALGIVYSLGRMQKKWETAREFWEGDIREEGRKAVRAAEESVAQVLEGGKGSDVTPQRLRELEEARELVAKAKDALARMK